MPNDAIDKAVSSAKSTLAKANKDFPTPQKPAATTPVAVAKPMTKPSTLGDSTIAPSLNEKQKNIQQYRMSAPPIMHKGGTVPKDGVYTLQKGEEVVPAGRSSEYRKVFEKRGAEGKHKYMAVPAHKQSNEEGGNSPAPKGEEKHDQPKAKKGIKDNVNS